MLRSPVTLLSRAVGKRLRAAAVRMTLKPEIVLASPVSWRCESLK